VLRQVEHLCLILSHLQCEACLCDLDPRHRCCPIRTIHRAGCYAVSSVSAVEQILAMVGSWRVHAFLNAASCDRTAQLADRFCPGHTGYGHDPFFAHEDAGEMEVAVSFRTWRLVSNCLHPLHCSSPSPSASLANSLQSRSLWIYQGWAGL